MQKVEIFQNLNTRFRASVAESDTIPCWAQAQAKIQSYPEVYRPILWEFFERVFAAIALVMTAPLMLAVAIAVKLDSKGPVLFRQYRVARGGRLFRFTKFRTYYHDAKERFPELYNYRIPASKLDDYLFKVPNDPRATRFGGWLRKTTLDELPNFWHVLTGEMALVGPRPEIPEFLPNYGDESLRIFTVKPGVTGLAQVSGRGWLTFSQTTYYNLKYLEIQSVLVDVRIVLTTVARVVLRHGAF